MEYSSPVELESAQTSAQPYTAASATDWAESHPSLLTQLEPLLGDDCEPDPAFFIDSWTVGAAIASENFLRRHQDRKTAQTNSGQHIPSFPFCSFPPFIRMEETNLNAASANCDPPLQPLRAELPFASADLLSPYRELPPAPVAFPLSADAARSVLGVAATSSREEIRAAYRHLASLCHPDRSAHHSDQERQAATERMASINEAYRLLSGPQRHDSEG